MTDKATLKALAAALDECFMVHRHDPSAQLHIRSGHLQPVTFPSCAGIIARAILEAEPRLTLLKPHRCDQYATDFGNCPVCDYLEDK